MLNIATLGVAMKSQFYGVFFFFLNILGFIRLKTGFENLICTVFINGINEINRVLKKIASTV